MFGLVSNLKECGHEVANDETFGMTMPTMHVENVELVSNLHARKHTTFLDLVHSLLLAEGMKRLVMQPESSPSSPQSYIQRYECPRRMFSTRDCDTERKLRTIMPYRNQQRTCNKNGVRGCCSKYCRTSEHLINLYRIHGKVPNKEGSSFHGHLERCPKG